MFFHQLKNELWKLFGKKRTFLGFAILLAAQAIIVTLLRFAPAAHRGLTRSLEHLGMQAGSYVSMLTVASLMAVLLGYSLLPLFVALVGGDLVSKEAEDGTLRMVLSRPVSRGRLLLLKWLAGCVFSVLLVIVLSFGDGFHRFLIAHLIMLSKAVTIMSLALMFSCGNLKPAAASILALSLVTIDRILFEIPFFQELKNYFLAHYLNCWQWAFLNPVPWWRVGQAVSLLAGLSLTFLIIGTAIFQTRDIKS
jgi:ABC-2 type transport system permease protein